MSTYIKDSGVDVHLRKIYLELHILTNRDSNFSNLFSLAQLADLFTMKECVSLMIDDFKSTKQI